jgi:hypothetical protein
MEHGAGGQGEQPPPPGQQPQQQPQQQPPPPPPQQQPSPPQQPVGPVGGEPSVFLEDPTKVWLLSLVTFGIYGIIWYHKVQEELGRWSNGQIEVNPTNSVLAITIGVCACLVPTFMSYAGTADRVARAQQMAGIPPRCTAGGFIGRLLLASYGLYWMQEQLNELAQRRPA